MRLFLIPDSYKGGSSLELRGKDYHYLKRVLRYRKGTEFHGRDAHGRIFNLQVKDITASTFILEASESGTAYIESPEITLYQCICKGKKMDLIIRQAAETGVSRIVPVTSDFSVSRLDKEKSGKLERWNKIIREAIQQSGSRISTMIGNPVSIEGIEDLSSSNKKMGLFFHQELLGSGTIHEYLSSEPDNISLVIGPEGGLSDRETKVLTKKKFNPVLFRTNVLRAETAALYAVSAVQTILQESENWMLK